jgi:hypothetical protein
MTADWRFEVLEVRTEPYAAAPTLMCRLRATAGGPGVVVQALALRVQIRIEPQRRQYAPAEADRLFELFGDAPQWADSIKPLLWTHASTMVPSFDGQADIDLPIACTYDFDVASAKYFHALDRGEVPLLFLFNGTAFMKAGPGWSVEPVPWDAEAAYRLPVSVWRETMDHYFPGSAWLRLGRDSFDALHRFKGRGAFPTWDAAIEALLAGAAAARTL